MLCLRCQRHTCCITHGAGSEQVPQPASDAFVKAKVVDWSQRRYALGCYSSPSLGEHPAACASDLLMC